MSKFIKSTYTLEEHLEAILDVKDLKSKGTPDKIICQKLGIGQLKLEKYKNLLKSYDLCSLNSDDNSLSSLEAINCKRIELDEQVQHTIYKLNTVIERIDEEYTKLKDYAQEKLRYDNRSEEDIKEMLKFLRVAKYPVEEVVGIHKVILNAIGLRAQIWGLDQELENKGDRNSKGNKKIFLFQLNNQQPGLSSSSVESSVKSIQKLNQIADSIVSESIGEIHGMQLQSKTTE